jgi:4-hydroxybutyrate CoA-transferase
MSWGEMYRQKVTTPEGAAGLIRSGDRVYIHIACAAPTVLVEALAGRGDSLQNVEIVDLVALYKTDFGAARWAGHFRHHALFIGAGCREAVAAGRADYTPVFLSEVERLFTSGALPLDVALMQLSPPDADGNMSLGIGVDTSLTAAQNARLVIAEVNRQMPRTIGESSIHVNRVAAIVETDHALIEVPPAPLTEVERRIGANVASLIPNGATLQIGIGGIPDAVLGCLGDHRDLGIHTEMVSDGMVPLMEAGVINGARKTLHPGKAVASFALGTQGMFRFLHENPMFEFHPCSYTNDPFVIARNENMVAVNSAIQVDVTGQVCSDSIGTRPYSGFGGQVDFMRGASRAKEGKPVIALPSTTRQDTVSRIVPMLDTGAGVVTTRADAHYVVTEYGVAYLHGKNLRQRAAALIAIAHPKFRDSLYEFAVKAHYMEKKPSAVSDQQSAAFG